MGRIESLRILEKFYANQRFTIVKSGLYLGYNRNLCMFKDPVCGMMVDEKTAKYVSQTKGGSVYLCSAVCKSEFDASKKYDTNYNNSSSNCCCCH